MTQQITPQVAETLRLLGTTPTPSGTYRSKHAARMPQGYTRPRHVYVTYVENNDLDVIVPNYRHRRFDAVADFVAELEMIADIEGATGTFYVELGF